MSLRWMLFLLLSLASASAQPVLPETGALEPLWSCRLEAFTDEAYLTALEKLTAAYEAEKEQRIAPGPLGKFGLKVFVEAGPGLMTPHALTRAMIAVLESRGFSRDQLVIIGHSETRLRECGYLPWSALKPAAFEGVPVIAIGTSRFTHPDWTYESNLTPDQSFLRRLTPDWMSYELPPTAKISYLASVLIEEVDGWINLPMAASNEALGIVGALANASVLSVTNHDRFLDSSTGGAIAVAEIAAIPELRDKRLFSVLSLESYQFVGGFRFQAAYARTEPLLWLSRDEVAMDALMWRRIAREKKAFGFEGWDKTPGLLTYAESLSLGTISIEDARLIDLSSLQ